MATDSLALPLQAPRGNNGEHNSLQSRIFQIYTQKGAFRHVTEASLTQEIKAQKQQDEDATMLDAEDIGAEQAEPSDRNQAVNKSREEIMQQLRRAQNDTLMTLDFVSLLLSKFAPTTAESTMSPALKDAVPAGTLEARLMKYTPLTVAESSSDWKVSTAYKLQGFSLAADRLLSAASRLEDEATKESRYWDETVSIKAKGWAISKTPRDPRMLAVHFGFRDAAPFYRNRGSAALKRNADGTLKLDHGAIRPKPVTLQLSIIRGGRCYGRSSFSSDAVAADTASIDDEILQARNTLFEEELFYELGREARLLANQGATMSLKQIRMPMDKDTELHLDLVGLESMQDRAESREAPGPDDTLAQGVSIALRILLCHAHEQSLRRRSQPPPPLTLEPKASPEYLLLRPILTHIQHQHNLRRLQSYLQSLTCPLNTAGLSASLKIAEPSLSLPLLNPSPTTNGRHMTTPTAVLNSLTTASLTTTLTLQLPTSRAQSIKLHTNLNPTLFGTEYIFYPSIQSYPSTNLSLPRLDTFEDLKRQLRHILTVDLVALIDSDSGDGVAANLVPEPIVFTDEPMKKEQLEEEETGVEKGKKDLKPTYHIQDPHTGSFFLLPHLRRHSHSQGQEERQHQQTNRKKIQISLRLQPGRLSMRYIQLTSTPHPRTPLTTNNPSQNIDKAACAAVTTNKAATTRTTTYMWKNDNTNADPNSNTDPNPNPNLNHGKLWKKTGTNAAELITTEQAKHTSSSRVGLGPGLALLDILNQVE